MTTEEKIVNLTPHDITVLNADGTVRTVIAPSGTLARMPMKTVSLGYSICGVPCTKNVYGAVEGLPDPIEGTVYVVSLPVAQQLRDRNDVYIPNETVRDEKGNVIGCRSIGRV